VEIAITINKIKTMKNVKNFEVFLNEARNQEATDIEKEIKLLQKENSKGFAAEIKKLKVRLAAINLSK
jgi:hypothetical protein